MARGVEISGLGHYAPARRVANAEIEAHLGLEAGWIFQRTGIEARRYVSDEEALSDIATAAGDMALNNANIDRASVALVLLATSTPDHLLPPSAPLIAHRLRLDTAGGIDMAGACGGFIYALTLADGFVRLHNAPVLVIAANVLSRRINSQDRASSVLFADAAGAALLLPSDRPDAGVIGAELASKGSRYDLIKIQSGGSRAPFSQTGNPNETLMVINDGKAVFTEAIDMMTEAARAALSKASVTPNDISRFIPHQANARMMDKVAHKLSVQPGKMLSTVREFANSSAATIPFTLSMAAMDRPLVQGETLLMTAAGAGMTGGAAVFRC
jgi:3-oxoacyl-[acyl-carrier-protein] synthase III